MFAVVDCFFRFFKNHQCEVGIKIIYGDRPIKPIDVAFFVTALSTSQATPRPVPRGRSAAFAQLGLAHAAKVMQGVPAFIPFLIIDSASNLRYRNLRYVGFRLLAKIM